MIPDTDSIHEARELMLSIDHAILSTQSVEYPGFPFGSVVPYVADADGAPVILISSIAQHTKNILKDPKVSLTMIQERQGDVQANGRLCLLGYMEPVDESETELQERYFRYYEAARTYHQVHEFKFYRLRSEAVRYIGGFGKIFWVKVEDFFTKNPFFGVGEAGMLKHMNEHHAASIRAYCQHYAGREVAADINPTLVGLDANGMDILIADERVRIPFENAISTPNEARELLTAMAHTAAAAPVTGA